MKAKLKSFSPTGESWEGKADAPGGAVTYYVQNVAFEDGTKGKANAKSQTPNWSIGAEYTFDVVTDQKGNVQIKKMSKVMNQGGVPARSGGYDDPKVQKRMCAAASAHCAVSFAKQIIARRRNVGNTEEYDNSLTMRLAKKFFHWTYVEGQTTDDMFNKKSAIAISIEEMDINATINTSDDVLARAELWLEYINTLE